MAWPSIVWQWGSTKAERTERFPCDGLIAAPDQTMFRAVDVEAPQAVTFRWLCQLRAAPYSYDKLDNLGRRSPQTLTPGLEDLALGQRVQTIFRLVDFEPGRSLTMVSEGRVFGRVAGTYRTDRVDERRSRIVVKLVVSHPRRLPHGPLMRLVLPPGDLVMMRRQLLNLKALAEGTASSPASNRAPSSPPTTTTSSARSAADGVRSQRSAFRAAGGDRGRQPRNRARLPRSDSRA